MYNNYMSYSFGKPLLYIKVTMTSNAVQITVEILFSRQRQYFPLKCGKTAISALTKTLALSEPKLAYMALIPRRLWRNLYYFTNLNCIRSHCVLKQNSTIIRVKVSINVGFTDISAKVIGNRFFFERYVQLYTITYVATLKK